jgi:hypothetical protein
MKVFLVIADCGDGSSSINWFKDTTLEQLYELEKEDPERWSSGDGLQYQELNFPDNFDFEALGVKYWADEEELEEEFEEYEDETT